ncbi:hypothetical protein OAG26_00925 [Flavobacteriales bacterium]|jgi:hypothetical protein|nr:hypothetical protein [Flavobacteriales bacterium]
MANKKAILEQLANFFAEQGKVLTPSEYKSMGNDDVPMRFMVAKRPFGSWSRMTQMLKVNFPDQWAKANKEVATPAKAEVKAAPKTAKAAPKKAKE